MSISSTTNVNQYTGNGATSSFSYTFRIFQDADLLVTVTDTDDVETTLTISTDYTVSDAGEESGGSVTLVNASQAWLDGDGDLLTGYKITIRRVLELLQETDIRNQGDFFPEVHEDFFDKSVMIAQQQQSEIDRSVKSPESVLASTFDPTLPADIATANVSVVTNSSGNGFIVGPTVTQIEQAESFSNAAETSKNLAQDWAVKVDGIVESTDYSSKAWAIGGTDVTETASRGAAKEWATKTDNPVDTSEYSSKEYAVGTQTRGTTGSAKDWATYTGGTVDASEFSAKYYAQQAQATVQFTKVSLAHTAFQTAALTNEIEAFSLPQNDLLTDLVIKTSTAFAGTGITTYVLNLGITTDTDKFIFQYDLTAAAANDNYRSASLSFPSFGGATSIRAEVIATGANLDQSTAGSVDIYWFKKDLE